ncbi:MAG: CPBP family intramembrane glutamic endopeptidase, partial [Lachnospiraceae bacterium]|nr:CPBP family intramembrane glutamic endopeptidase [Lachnospiraceae bacterium]
MNRKMAEAVLPMLMFVVIREILGSLLAILQAVLLQQADAGVLAFVSVHDADLRALSGAISMAGAFALTLWNARGEVNLQSGCSGELLRSACGDGSPRGACGDRMPQGARGEAMSGERLRARGDQLIAAAAGILAASVFLNLFLAGVGAVHADAAAADASAQAGRVSLPLGILIYGVLSPLAEETVFRGITLQRLYLLCHEKKSGKTAFLLAAGLSSLLFGIYHGSLVQGLYAAAMGFLFCLFLALGGNLFSLIILHGGANVMTLFLSRAGTFRRASASVMAGAFGIAFCCGGYVL